MKSEELKILKERADKQDIAINNSKELEMLRFSSMQQSGMRHYIVGCGVAGAAAGVGVWFGLALCLPNIILSLFSIKLFDIIDYGHVAEFTLTGIAIGLVLGGISWQRANKKLDSMKKRGDHARG